ncbi:hypothetical protein OIV83_005099 [Microbotryomycetes sp. JL201]|nr:hypothetical protein OIV83_005099 [Microbotryomycetes sp. JL201]
MNPTNYIDTTGLFNHGNGPAPQAVAAALTISPHDSPVWHRSFVQLLSQAHMGSHTAGEVFRAAFITNYAEFLRTFHVQFGPDRSPVAFTHDEYFAGFLSKFLCMANATFNWYGQHVPLDSAHRMMLSEGNCTLAMIVNVVKCFLPPPNGTNPLLECLRQESARVHYSSIPPSGSMAPPPHPSTYRQR